MDYHVHVQAQSHTLASPSHPSIILHADLEPHGGEIPAQVEACSGVQIPLLSAGGTEPLQPVPPGSYLNEKAGNLQLHPRPLFLFYFVYPFLFVDSRAKRERNREKPHTRKSTKTCGRSRSHATHPPSLESQPHTSIKQKEKKHASGTHWASTSAVRRGSDARTTRRLLWDTHPPFLPAYVNTHKPIRPHPPIRGPRVGSDKKEKGGNHPKPTRACALTPVG